MSKSYEYYADGTLKFSSEALDHRFDRLYRWDHAGRIKEALSGGEARDEAATTNRPYKQLFAYDAIGHLTERTKYRWFLGPDTSTDSYTNNRHDPVGQLWQYDADGNTVSMPGTGYTYDAGGRVAQMTSGTPSTATLSWDGDEKKLKSVEVVWNPETETDITTTSYFIHSTVLGRPLTEFVYSDDPDVTVPGFFTRTLVYGDSGGVIAYQLGFGGGSGEVWFEYRDPSNASYRAITNTGAPSIEQELDPTGANQGVTDPATQSIPDEGLLAAYPNTFNPAQPFAAYSIDGMRVSLDEFIQQVHFQFHGELGLNEAIAVGSRYPRPKPESAPSVGEGESLLEYSPMWIFGLKPGPQKPGFLIGRFGFNANETERLRRAYDKITSEKCDRFFDATLAALRQRGEIHSGFSETPTTLSQTLSVTTINKYSSSLTAKDVGVSQASWSKVKDKFDNAQGVGRYGLGVTLADGRVFLPDNAFYQAGTLAFIVYKDADLAGIITHELFHRAGLNEDQVTNLRDDIQRNCGTPGDALGN